MQTIFYKKEMLTYMLSETNIYKSQHHKSSLDRNISIMAFNIKEIFFIY